MRFISLKATLLALVVLLAMTLQTTVLAADSLTTVQEAINSGLFTIEDYVSLHDLIDQNDSKRACAYTVILLLVLVAIGIGSNGSLLAFTLYLFLIAAPVSMGTLYVFQTSDPQMVLLTKNMSSWSKQKGLILKLAIADKIFV